MSVTQLNLGPKPKAKRIFHIVLAAFGGESIIRMLNANKSKPTSQTFPAIPPSIAAPMAATIATMSMLNAKCMSPKIPNPSKPTNPTKPISLLPIKNLPKGLTCTSPLAGTALAGAIFSTLSSCDAAMAAQQLSDIAEGDNRGLALLLPIIPAIGWVLFNILQPALNQISRMRSARGFIIGLGLGGLAASSTHFMSPPSASASELAAIAEAASSDNRGTLLLIVVTPAILWVLYNILQPALNQINRMRSE
ncbi:Photosystem II PsbY [Dillenia turbinata]|uniref:Photosystem II PsbY n=1 Tax=Dillenia turbinata TaxID=194707 RepID=A0AAN8VNG4_9MAGN